MYVKMKKTTLIVFSVLAGLLIAGLCAGILVTDLLRKNERNQYRADLAAGWRQSVSELSASLIELEIDLQKGLYSSGNYQTVSWAAQVFFEAGAARAALEALPIYELRLDGTETFLNQVGEFTLEMARKQLRGESLEEEEQQSLKTLALRSGELADEILTVSEKIADENPGYDELREMLLPSEEGEEKTDFESLEEIFSGDAPLVYDGDFSAWRETRTSDWLKELSSVSQESLRQSAAELLSVGESDLTENGRFETPFAYREYSSGENVAAFTEQGGLLYGFSRLREVSEQTLSVEDAVLKGAEGLAQLGYGAMEAISWMSEENTLTVVYALRQNGVLVYSDRITVTLALDNGEIMTVNAVEYLLAHNPERDASYTIGKEEAATVLRDDLIVESVDLVSVPGGDGSEKLCWQMTVHDDSKTVVLVFVNARTKVEEDILFLLEDEGFRKAI